LFGDCLAYFFLKFFFEVRYSKRDRKSASAAKYTGVRIIERASCAIHSGDAIIPRQCVLPDAPSKPGEQIMSPFGQVLGLGRQSIQQQRQHVVCQMVKKLAHRINTLPAIGTTRHNYVLVLKVGKIVPLNFVF
jgi:hypothetical protein